MESTETDKFERWFASCQFRCLFRFIFEISHHFKEIPRRRSGVYTTLDPKIQQLCSKTYLIVILGNSAGTLALDSTETDKTERWFASCQFVNPYQSEMRHDSKSGVFVGHSRPPRAAQEGAGWDSLFNRYTRLMYEHAGFGFDCNGQI